MCEVRGRCTPRSSHAAPRGPGCRQSGSRRTSSRKSWRRATAAAEHPPTSGNPEAVQPVAGDEGNRAADTLHELGHRGRRVGRNICWHSSRSHDNLPQSAPLPSRRPDTPNNCTLQPLVLRKMCCPGVLGFDCEWRPQFRAGVPQHPVALLQLAAAEGVRSPPRGGGVELTRGSSCALPSQPPARTPSAGMLTVPP